MSRRKHLPKELNENPTNIGGWTPDKEHRVSSGLDNEGRMRYVWDKKEVISHADGFNMLTGRDKVPSSLTSFLNVSDERIKEIFGDK